MANTYTKIYIHLIFAVQNREALISPEWESQLYKYITGIVQNKGQKMLAINGTQSHVHLFLGLQPDCVVSNLVREIKKSSNAFIKDKQFTRFRFHWQSGFGAFSYADSQIDSVVKYIMNQKEYHTKKTFKEEYIAFLDIFQVDYDPKYLYEWIE